jgi:DNA-binding GntR family transcriptional regulator
MQILWFNNPMITSNQPPTRESDRVEAELRQLILTLELEPGLAISEASLMKQYGWGRTPLREAIQRLAEQSLLQIIPRQGVVVTALSVFDFAEMMDAMSMVIEPAAALACKRLTADELDQLEGVVDASESAAQDGDFVKVSQLDFEFHRLLADATGNRHLSRYLLHLHQVATRFNFAAWKRDRNAAPSIAEHRQILEIMRQRDVEGAKSAMRAHIEKARTRIVGTMAVAE